MNVRDAHDLAYTIGPDYAVTLADEVERQAAEIVRLFGMTIDLETELAATRETLRELNDVLDATFPELAQHVEQHPAAQSPARLRIVTADTAAPCDQ